MEKIITKTGKTVDEAIEAALSELGVSKEEASIEVISEPKSGLLGIGQKQAEVKVTANVEENEEVVYYGDDENFEGDAVSEAEDQAVAFVAEVLSGIGIHGNMDSYREDDDIFISVTGADCGSAIGRHGETLEAISYMTNLVANKNSENRVRVHIDIGGYRKHREQVLTGLANKAAFKAKKTGRSVAMEAMNPAERRIVHSFLQNVSGVSTHSEGEEPERRVIVTPEK
ncbi:MAG: RNA-binding cell elongation regulator Jag/EloR [Saccharofermentanaceae bacterium]|jgi:spoIIIJ-associated protein|nr:protein jag [Clostridia bacterium]NLX68411.1 protein jag [Clostridiaceae bacterium]HOO48806.1 RNA-binding cell elongation regulator Jag/EloR [Saccharofermentans sp.]HPG64730.1 RNA-binding cell elongation regulator Jag/EloR [Saccharofermentans sp.]HPJ81003.1 RNA-binding cell elongation regulator Jag/EloR [Saccharofermentans sp.]